MIKLTKKDNIFDGFIHRPFDPSIDGWRNEIPDENDYPSVPLARDILGMWYELCSAKRRIWELEQMLGIHGDVKTGVKDD